MHGAGQGTAGDLAAKKSVVDELTLEERKALIDRNSPDLSITAQADLYGVNRSTLYYKPVPPSPEDMAIRKRIDQIYMEHPFFGYRKMTAMLQSDGYDIGEYAVRSKMRDMNLQAVYPRPDTSRPNPANKIYPYLLKDVTIDHPDQVWSIDITYVPVKTSHMYLVAIIDWYSRYVLAWKLSDSMEIKFVLECCRDALEVTTPEIMNCDQGSQFTSPQFIDIFKAAGAQISMDHKGRAFDNIFIERFWRSVKYENIYLRDYETPRAARVGLGDYMPFYNCIRPHGALGNAKPEEVYLGQVKLAPAHWIER